MEVHDESVFPQMVRGPESPNWNPTHDMGRAKIKANPLCFSVAFAAPPYIPVIY